MNNPIIRTIIISVFFFMCIGLIRSIITNLQRTDLVAERQTALQKEEQKNRELQNELREATSASFVERQARDKLGLVRTGDTVVLIGPSGSGQHESNSPGTENLTRWQKWWKLFF